MKAIIDNNPKKRCTVLTNNGILALVQMDRNGERKIVFSHRLTFQTHIKNSKALNILISTMPEALALKYSSNER